MKNWNMERIPANPYNPFTNREGSLFVRSWDAQLNSLKTMSALKLRSLIVSTLTNQLNILVVSDNQVQCLPGWAKDSPVPDLKNFWNFGLLSTPVNSNRFLTGSVVNTSNVGLVILLGVNGCLDGPNVNFFALNVPLVTISTYTKSKEVGLRSGVSPVASVEVDRLGVVSEASIGSFVKDLVTGAAQNSRAVALRGVKRSISKLSAHFKTLRTDDGMSSGFKGSKLKKRPTKDLPKV